MKSNGAKQAPPEGAEQNLDHLWFRSAYDQLITEAAHLPAIKVSKPGNEVSNHMLKIASLIKGTSNPGVTSDQALTDFLGSYQHGQDKKAFTYQWNRHMRNATPRQREVTYQNGNGNGKTAARPRPRTVTKPVENQAAISQPISQPPEPAQPTPKPPLIIDTKHPKTKDYLTALDWLGYKFRLNMMGRIREVNGERLQDEIEAVIQNEMADLGLTSSSRVEKAWIQMGWENRYHPIQEYLSGLVWDGQDHISRLVHDYLTETTGFGEVAFTRWLIGCIVKVFQAQDAQNFMMVWDGPQGIGKSHLARWLCPFPRYFVESQLQPDNKDHQVWALQNWIWEVGELQSTTRRSDREALKHFITQKEITVRKAFGKNELNGPMLCNFIGTINNTGTGFLSDPTGNRRFVTIFIASINHTYTSEMDINQVWAQAMHHYKSGMSHHLAPEEQQRSNEINDSYLVTNPVSEFFWEKFGINHDSQNVMTSIQIIRELEGAGLKGNQTQLLKDLAELMKLHNVTKVRTRSNAGQISGYRGIFTK